MNPFKQHIDDLISIPRYTGIRGLLITIISLIPLLIFLFYNTYSIKIKPIYNIKENEIVLNKSYKNLNEQKIIILKNNELLNQNTLIINDRSIYFPISKNDSISITIISSIKISNIILNNILGLPI